jgi:glycosyltransferase involved in cell wall biosynthesis
VLGERDDVNRWIARSDVVVHASRSPEPFGQVVVEGMAAGAAVVATVGGGPSELLRDGVDGLLVPPDDVAAMAAALRRLAADPAERLRLGLAAQARVDQLTHPASVGTAVDAVHARAAARRPR